MSREETALSFLYLSQAVLFMVFLFCLAWLVNFLWDLFRKRK